jgi:hypothetical protein
MTSSPSFNTVSPRGTTMLVAQHRTTVLSREAGSMICLPLTGESEASLTSARRGGHPRTRQAHQRADRDGFLDERGEQVRCGHRHVDAPGLVEQPLVVRVVDAGHDAGHAELLLREQRDDEVHLVVAGDRHDDLGGLGMGQRELGDLAPVDVQGRDALPQPGGLGAGEAIGVELDDEHLVLGVTELGGDVGADVAATDDDHAHQ